MFRTNTIAFLLCIASAVSPFWLGEVQGQKPKTAAVKTQRFILKSGTAFDGRVSKRKASGLIVKTVLGERRVHAADIAEEADASPVAERYAKRLAKMGQKPKLASRIELARWCDRIGYTTGLGEQLNAILAASPSNAVAWKIIQKLAPAFRPASHNPVSPAKNRWSRKEADILIAALARADRAQSAILAEKLRHLPEETVINPVLKSASRGKESARLACALVMGDFKSTRRVKPLYQRALNDPSWQVRQTAVESLRRRDDGTTLGPFLKVLVGAQTGRARTYAAEAIGLLGDRRAIPALIGALRAAGDNPKSRSNITITRQTAYIKDFDVEVAQSAFIADPIVGVAQDGAVLDVAVVSVTVERRVIGGALGRLSGRRFGSDWRKWSAWWKEQKSKS